MWFPPIYTSKTIIEKGYECIPFHYNQTQIYFFVISVFTVIVTSSLTATPPASRVLFHDTP